MSAGLLGRRELRGPLLLLALAAPMPVLAAPMPAGLLRLLPGLLRAQRLRALLESRPARQLVVRQPSEPVLSLALALALALAN